MTEPIKCAGGTVVKEGRKWQVFAPDNRHVGIFPTKKQACWLAVGIKQDVCLFEYLSS